MESAIDAFLADYAQQPEKTRRFYEDQVGRALRQFLARQGVTRLADITAPLLRLYLQDQAQVVTRSGKPLGSKSLGHRHQSARRFLAWCVEQQYLPSNPGMLVKKPRVIETLRVGYNAAELDAMMRALTYTTRKRPWIEYRDRAIIAVLISTGVRADELVGLTLDAIDWQMYLPAPARRPRIRILRKGGRERLMPLGKKAQDALRSYLSVRPRVPEAALWLTLYGEPMDYQALRLMLRRLGEYSGVEKMEAHRFRHTYAVEHYRANRDIEALRQALDHRSIETTVKYLRGLGVNFHFEAKYAHPDEWLI